MQVLNVNKGVCVFTQQQQLFCSHYKHALVDYWHAQIKELGNLEGKALLLPVRVNLEKADCELIAQQQSWFTLLGFELVIEKQFVMVKKLPTCLYLLEVSAAVESLLGACKTQLNELKAWLTWQLSCVPERFYESNAFIELQISLQNNPQTIERLKEKAVKIDLEHYLTQLN